MTSDARNYLCIHGHFYQPPRENPWLQHIEIQESASPFHDWNERIAHECYTPNAHARILDDQGGLINVINNYEYISFNIGPTLLQWLESEVPGTYDAILRADRESAAKRSGHGNAVAQAYNHMIMPLASTRDKATQIVWGMEDFRRRFGRDPEGMWLPETAVDLETLDLMAQNGIRFTILAPGQAKSFRDPDRDDWIKCADSPIDPTRAYRCELFEGRSIALFFYDGGASHAVAFEQLLNNGDHFKSRLLTVLSNDRPWSQLAHIATDGESFGHHHRFGEMALAYAVMQLLKEPDVTLTNYGEYLERHPPIAEARIEENSAWSCAHGVGRWYRDCGCSLAQRADWNQRWRTPLRESLDLVRDRTSHIFDEVGTTLLTDPWSARDAYIQVLLADHDNVTDFLAKHSTKTLSPEEQVTALHLLEMQRNAMLMYTSCGWFFDDISGIEALQILRYAARVIQLAAPFDERLRDDFLKSMAGAESNVKPNPHGDEIFQNRIAPLVADLPRVAAHAAIWSLFGDLPATGRHYCYDIDIADTVRRESGQWILLNGRMTVRSRITTQSRQFTYAVLHLGGVDFRCSLKEFPGVEESERIGEELARAFLSQSATELIRSLDTIFQGSYYSVRDLFVEERANLLENVTTRLYEEQADTLETFYKNNKGLARYIRDSEGKVPDTFIAAARFVLNRMFAAELERLAQGAYPDNLEQVLEESRFWKIKRDTDTAAKRIREAVQSLLSDLKANPQEADPIEDINHLLDLAETLDIPLDLAEAQIAFFQIIRSLAHGPAGPVPSEFRNLAERLRIHINLDDPERGIPGGR